MNGQRDTGVMHLDPTKDKFNLVGIALAAEGHTPGDVIGFYHRTGVLPDVHPVVLYEVKPRGKEGHKLTRALISLQEGLVLIVSTHMFYVTYGARSHNPSTSDIELARRTLQTMGILQYESTLTTGEGTKIKTPVHVTRQIDDLIDLQLAMLHET